MARIGPSADIAIGSAVRVLSSSRPSLVGRCGRVHSTDASRWCTVQLEDGLLASVRTAALRVLEDLAEAVLSAPEHSSLSAPAPSASALSVGAVVAIVATENVQQRAPQRVGERGVVVEAPVHPTTWFKVQFADRRVLAFRPSALVVLDEDRSAPPSKGLSSSDRVRSRDGEDSILHQTVLILRGRLQGLLGHVAKSGNGWVQLSTAQGEVAKRVHEVRIVERVPRLRSESLATDGEAPSPEPQALDEALPKRPADFDGDWLLPPSKALRTPACAPYSLAEPDARQPTILSRLEAKQF